MFLQSPVLIKIALFWIFDISSREPAAAQIFFQPYYIFSYKNKKLSG